MSKVQSNVLTSSALTPPHLPEQSQPVPLPPSPTVTMPTRPINNIMVHALQRRPMVPGKLH